MRESFTRRPALGLLLVALIAFVMIGLVDGALGVAWPSMQAAFDRSVADLGLLLAFGGVGYLTASAGYGWLHAKLGTGTLLGVGSVLLAVSLAGIALAPVWAVVVVSSVFLGLGGAFVDTGINAHAALAFDIRSMNLLHACFGVGATLGPVVITMSLISSGAWRSGYLAIAALQVVVALLVWHRRREWAGAEQAETRPVSQRSPATRQTRVFITLFFLYTGVELGTGQWAFTLLSESRGMATAAAGTWVAVYWGGLTIGRFGFGIVGGRLQPSTILGGSMLVALTGVGLLWLDLWGLGMVGLPIAGLGLAAIFPTLISLTPAKIGRDRSTRSIGYQLAAASLGAASVPWVIGLVAAATGLEALGAGLFLTAVVLVVVYLLSARMDRRRVHVD